MNIKPVTSVVIFLLLLATNHYVIAEDPEEILQRRVGTWITQATSKKAEWTPEEVTTKGEETISWKLDKHVLEFEGWANPNNHKSLGLMVYDRQSKLYRSWFFNNHGVIPRSETAGTWDEENQTLHLRSDLGNGNRQDLKLVYTNKDRFDWTMVIRNKDGRLMMDVVGHSTRKK